VEERPLHSPSLQEVHLPALATPTTILSCGLDLPGLPVLRKVLVNGVCLGGFKAEESFTPEQVQQFAMALAGWPVEPEEGVFRLRLIRKLPRSESLALLQALACPQLQSAAWPKQVSRVPVSRMDWGAEEEQAVRSVPSS
jgi:hypothetical protein